MVNRIALGAQIAKELKNEVLSLGADTCQCVE